MKKISIQSLNSVFNLVEELSSTVVWIRDITVTKQIYLNDNYEKIWERSKLELFSNPSSFNKSLYVENNFLRNSNESGLNLFRIKNNRDEILHIRDQHFLLADEQGQAIGRMGFAVVVPEQQWSNMLECLQTERSTQPANYHDVIEIVQREFMISATANMPDQKKSQPIDHFIAEYCARKKIKLTPREIQCLSYLLNGNIPKQIASLMNVSTRTIEFHLENIRNKCGCKTTVQLLSQIIV